MFAPDDFSSWYDASISSANTQWNGRFERRRPLPKEYRHIAARHRPQFLYLGKASDLKAECISVMLLCAFDISDPATPALVGQLSSFSLLRPTERSSLRYKTALASGFCSAAAAEAKDLDQRLRQIKAGRQLPG